jgi:hypothetical protein
MSEYADYLEEGTRLFDEWNRAGHKTAGAVRRGAIQLARREAKRWQELKDAYEAHLKKGEAAGYWQEEVKAP